MVLDRPLNAAELYATHNRVSVSPDVVRRLGTALGYEAIEAFGENTTKRLATVFDLGDIIDLLLLGQLPDLEVAPAMEQQVEADVARKLVRRISAGDYLTRQQVHDLLPRETVTLFRMGHPRLWAFAVRQRLPRNAEKAIPESFHRDITGPYTTPEEAWLGMYVADATHLGELDARVEGAGLDEDRQQRLRLGMSLADTYRQVWSSARGHWRVSPNTTYIVPSRLGYCPFVFRVAEGGWRCDSFDGGQDRYMATEGYWIDVERERLIHLGAPDPNDSWLPTVSVAAEPPSETDLQVARALSGKLIALGAAQKNITIRLRQKNRTLSFD
ncbi:hypothetical protein FNY88_02115 [Corynebacterium guaraldiae]|uniref:XRE family transcriptional regulator n=1 Tax=Corynebacterium guaraldiae TaxID=3051103 RepID=A0ABY3CYP7_9CORY|nr:hypothetical protein HMPREF2760_07435 [Corynebacterium sp. HMSC065D07]TRX32456.1 hypothetical protein FNY86_08760 [Corynebacterium guaraldiae]TRX42574.1 hypothetical protein FNY89_03525 [Corynebacterium guaraldiae]TRX50586.1 hypothetical protein FNY88_02115 [Corynebacterium guaraldiae]TRX51497.1 hypothetical protein FNY91_09250 [Corynebacterium guaraldiae]